MGLRVTCLGLAECCHSVGPAGERVSLYYQRLTSFHDRACDADRYCNARYLRGYSITNNIDCRVPFAKQGSPCAGSGTIEFDDDWEGSTVGSVCTARIRLSFENAGVVEDLIKCFTSSSFRSRSESTAATFFAVSWSCRVFPSRVTRSTAGNAS